MATVNLLDDTSNPTPPSDNAPNVAKAQPYTNWQDERNWALPMFQSHVQSKPFLYGKVGDSDYENAFNLYNGFRQTLPNRGDAFNATLDKLGWWTGTPTYNAGQSQTAANPWQALWDQSGRNPQSFVSSYIAQRGLRGAQTDPAALNEIAGVLNSLGVNAALDQRTDQYHKGLMINGQFVKMLDGSDRWIWDQGAGGAGSSANDLLSSYQAQFSDPLTRQYEQLLQTQTGLYQQQQQQLQAERERQAAVRAQTDAAVQRLTEFANQRIAKLQQPAYTGTEQEVLRTRALDPIESDRTAAEKRALENIGARGFDPSSGIAQELLSMVDRGADQDRAVAQNNLAYQQIQEERSREQEAQQLLEYLTQLPTAAATGDLNYVNLLNSMINEAGQGAVGTGAVLADLPVQRTRLGADILGLSSGSATSNLNGVLQLLQQAQQNRILNQQVSANFYNNLGRAYTGY